MPPQTAKGWLLRAYQILEWRRSPHSVLYGRTSREDRRCNDRFEEGISVLNILQKLGENGGGRGVGLMFDYFVGEMSIYSFSEHEQRLIHTAARNFTHALQDVGFLPKGEDFHDRDGDAA